MRWLCAVVLGTLAVGALRTAQAEVGKTTLARLAMRADLVCVGRVVRVVTVAVRTNPAADLDATLRASLAEVAILDPLAGAPTSGPVWVWVTPTWTCDETCAQAGETALWFLQRSGVADLVAPVSLPRVDAVTGGAPVHRVAWSGLGRMAIRPVAGREYAEVATMYVRTPGGVESIPPEEPRWPSLKRSVRLDDLRRFVRRVRPAARASDATTLRLLLAAVGRAEDGEQREHALEAIQHLGNGVAGRLLEVVADPASPLREVAAEALGFLDEEGQRALLAALDAEAVRTRRAAAYALECIAWQGPIWGDPFLVSVAAHTADPDAEVHARLLRALLREGSSMEDRAIRGLAGAAADPSPDLALEAARMIAEVFPEQLDGEDFAQTRARMEQALLQRVCERDLALRRAAWEALARVAGAASWPAVQRALSDADPVVRACATRTLARIPSPASVARRVELLADPNASIRRTAAWALGRPGLASGVEPLVRALGDGDASVGGIAAWALGRIGKAAQSAVPALEAIERARRGSALGDEARLALEALREGG